MLKPALAGGELRCIGSTTYQEYKASFERDRALARRFQKIEVARAHRSRRRVAHPRGPEAAATRSTTASTYTDEALRAAAELVGASTSTTASCPTRRST